MLRKEMSKLEIEKFLSDKGDFVKIDHLTRFLKEQNIPTDLKKFCYTKLAEIYTGRAMYGEAAKMYSNMATISLTYEDKIKAHMKEAELAIKAGIFENADDALKKAISQANSTQRAEILNSIKEFYLKQAVVYENEKRRNNAIKIYEKMLTMSITESQRDELKRKLLTLYEETGRIKEYMVLKDKFKIQ